MELVGTLNYPKTMTKLECRLHVSKLSKYLRKWSKEHWDKAIKVLMCCITSKKIGLIYSRSLDEHGVNILHDHAYSGFSPDRSDGCRYMMMNGAVTSGSAKQHPTVDDSSTKAELTASMQQTTLLHSEVSLVNLVSNSKSQVLSTRTTNQP